MHGVRDPAMMPYAQAYDILTRVGKADDGRLTVPLDGKYVADKADFVTNKKNGSIKAHMILVPLLPRENLTHADLGASLAAARLAIAELMPWYLRLLFGRVHQVRLCYPEAGVLVGTGADARRIARDEEQNPLNGKTVYCAGFDAGEVEGAAPTAVDAPPGWVALFK
jgi:hypothetical protein